MMLIKSILIPRLLYGIEIYGYRYSHLLGAKKILNSAITKIVGSYNFCRSAAYEELGILTPETMGKIWQQKRTIEWSNSRGIIKDLLESNVRIKNKDNPRSIQRTWINEAIEWGKRKGTTELSVKEMKTKIVEMYNEKKRFNPDTKINRLRRELHIDKPSKILLRCTPTQV